MDIYGKIILEILKNNKIGKTYEEINEILSKINENYNVRKSLNSLINGSFVLQNGERYLLNPNAPKPGKEQHTIFEISNDWDAYAFYDYVKKVWEELCDTNGIVDREKYFVSQSYEFPIEEISKDSKNYLFIELVFHLQNRQGTGSINMDYKNPDSHYTNIVRTLCNGDVSAFLDYYNNLPGDICAKQEAVCRSMGINFKFDSKHFVDQIVEVANALSKPEFVDRNSIITLNEIKENLSTREIIEALKFGFKEKFETIEF